MTGPVRLLGAALVLSVVVSACTTSAADPDDRPLVGVTLPEVESSDDVVVDPDADESDGDDRPGGLRPETIVVAGDSIALGLGTFLRDVVTDDVEVELVAEEGTGLAFPNGTNWPEQVEEAAEHDPPSVLLFSVGTNDDQNLLDDNGAVVVRRTSSRWDDEYRGRLERVFDAFEDTGTEVWWVGHVCTRRDEVCETNREIQALAVEAAEDRPWVVIADLGELLGVGDEVPTECLTSDGVHIQGRCLRDAAVDLLDELAPAILELPDDEDSLLDDGE